MKAKAIILFILGTIFILGIPSYEDIGTALVGIALAAICFYFGWRSIKKKRTAADTVKTVTNTVKTVTNTANTVTDASTTSTPKAENPYDFLRIKVAGVTFKNGRKSRQSILRAIKFRDGEFSEGIELELKQYEWEGKPAYGIYANGQQIGNVPADMVGYISENYKRIVDFSAIEVYGGGRDKEGYAKNFGCEIVLRLRK